SRSGFVCWAAARPLNTGGRATGERSIAATGTPLWKGGGSRPPQTQATQGLSYQRICLRVCASANPAGAIRDTVFLMVRREQGHVKMRAQGAPFPGKGIRMRLQE